MTPPEPPSPRGRLDEIKERWAKATPGPWSQSPETIAGCVWVSKWNEPLAEPLFKFRNTAMYKRREADAEAVANAPDDIVWLIEQLEVRMSQPAPDARGAEATREKVERVFELQEHTMKTWPLYSPAAQEGGLMVLNNLRREILPLLDPRAGGAEEVGTGECMNCCYPAPGRRCADGNHVFAEGRQDG